MIADDNNRMRQTLKVLIASMENAVVLGEAHNGEDAITLANKLLPDIILMDINMSPVNGFEATRKILRQNPATRIIGLSLHQQPSYAKNMLKIGACGYVTKSASHLEIIEAIRTVAAGGKYIDKEIRGSL